MSASGGLVFISYSRGDAEFCRDLRERLVAAGIRTWMDVIDIPAGARWPDAIDRALNASEVVLGVMTPESLESANVKNEWDWALANGRRLVLFMLRPCRVPFHYVSINYIDGTSGLGGALAELTRSLAAALPLAEPGEPPSATAPLTSCGACGHAISQADRFCPSCGRSLVASVSDSVGARSQPVDVTLPAAMLDEPGEHPLDLVDHDVFVGREQHLDQLRAALQQTLADQGQIALVAGEPGIGKTRLLEIFERIASHRGAAVCWGRCYEWEGAPAFWPWVQVLRELIQLDDPARLRATLGGGAADIAQIVPELRALLPDLPATLNLDPEQLRFRLFDAITTFLR
ncbi:MAG: TIR domain-containing protein, partial [Vicinamibacterales bacterium]